MKPKGPKRNKIAFGAQKTKWFLFPAAFGKPVSLPKAVLRNKKIDSALLLPLGELF